MGIEGELKNGEVKATPNRTFAEICSCPVCMEVFKDPVQLSCCFNHLCRGCFDRSAQEGCPMCRNRNVRSERVAPSLKKHLRKVRMLCKHTTCPQNKEGISVEDYESHVQFCRHAPEMCEFCEQNFSQLMISAHKENDCTERWKRSARSAQDLEQENSRLKNEVHRLKRELQNKDDENQRHVRAIQQTDYDIKLLKDDIRRRDAEISILKEHNENHGQIMAKTMREQMEAMLRTMTINGQVPVHSMNPGPIPTQGFSSYAPPPQQTNNSNTGGLNQSYQSEVEYLTSTQDLSRSRGSTSSTSSFVNKSYEKENPFQRYPIMSTPSLENVEEQHTTSYQKHAMPAPPAPTNVSVARGFWNKSRLTTINVQIRHKGQTVKNVVLNVESADNLEAQILNEVQLSGLYRLFYNFEGEEDAGFFKDEFEGRIESLHNKRIIANTVFVAGRK